MAEASGSNNNSEIINENMKDDTGVNYQHIENQLMGFHHQHQQQQQLHLHHSHQHHNNHHHHQKFDLSNKHISANNNSSNEKAISYNQQATRSNLSDSSLPLDLCQVNTIMI